MNTRFRMYDINLDQFAILSKKAPESDINFNISMSFKYADNGQKVACTVNYDFYEKDEKIIVLQTTCAFDIHPDDWKGLIKDDVVTIPKGLLENFGVHTVGTSRGIMYCKTEKTPFNRIIIPPIDVTKLVKGDCIIKIEDNK